MLYQWFITKMDNFHLHCLCSTYHIKYQDNYWRYQTLSPQ